MKRQSTDPEQAPWRLSSAEGLSQLFPGVPVKEARKLAEQLHNKGELVHNGVTYLWDATLHRKDHTHGVIRIRSPDSDGMAAQREAFGKLQSAIEQHPVHPDVEAAIHHALATQKQCAEKALARREEQLPVALGLPKFIASYDAGSAAKHNTGSRGSRYAKEYGTWRGAAMAELQAHPEQRERLMVTAIIERTGTKASRDVVRKWWNDNERDVRAKVRAAKSWV